MHVCIHTQTHTKTHKCTHTANMHAIAICERDFEKEWGGMYDRIYGGRKRKREIICFKFVIQS